MNKNKLSNLPFIAVQQVDPDGQKDIGEENVLVGLGPDIFGPANLDTSGNQEETGTLGPTDPDTSNNGSDRPSQLTETSDDE